MPHSPIRLIPLGYAQKCATQLGARQSQLQLRKPSGGLFVRLPFEDVNKAIYQFICLVVVPPMQENTSHIKEERLKSRSIGHVMPSRCLIPVVSVGYPPKRTYPQC